ncbi:preprotein translocase subunit SecA [Candidatus Parcubacteria bacterium]|nr:preprotein translocase subunit SecA [Candidatus Parcubacteria bacterium]
MFKPIAGLFDSNERQLKKLQPLVEKINSLEPEIEKLSDGRLRAKTDEFRQRAQSGRARHASQARQAGVTLDDLLPEAFAVVREVSKRTTKMRPFDVQLMAGIVLHQGRIAEQRTGEGKTLTATLPLYLNALGGKGCHLVTPNDYLSRHGAGWMGPIYHFLGLSVGVIVHDQAFLYDPEHENSSFLDDYSRHFRPVARAEAYRADITYGTNNEFGFDYLRDNMVWDQAQMVQTSPRGDWGAHAYAIVDEVDSILIDEARTPLIISAPAEESSQKYHEVSSLVGRLVSKTDYTIDEKAKAASLTELGINKLERMLKVDNLYEKDFETVRLVEQALRAKTLFQKDRDYVVKDGQVVIVDEFTGRMMFGRRYSEGLHQSIEAKEGAEIQRESKTLATISFQNYFRMYEKLAGMTGTAATEAEEFYKIYGLEVMVIPTHKPMTRQDNSDAVYKTEAAKWRAVVMEIEDCFRRGQPVLVGTTSVEKNELLNNFLKRKKVPHEVLNAKHHEKEALIIAQAGRKGAVTVATNMAGRGVDIILGGDPRQVEDWEKAHDEVIAAGGLHVIGTERHEARRIDNQLRGRSGRQGDPGSSRFFVALQDDLMRIFGGAAIERVMDRFGLDESVPLEHGMVSKSIENAQKRVEGHNFDIRKHLVEYDDVMNHQREIIYRLRRKVLAIGRAESGEVTGWLLEKLQPYSGEIKEVWERRERELKDVWPKVVRQVSLPVIDTLWMEHLSTMDDLREGIGLRGYAQKDPLVEYKREGRQMFERLVEDVYAAVAERLTKIQFEGAPSEVRQPARRLAFEHKPAELGVADEVADITGRRQQQKGTYTRAAGKVGRNDPCPCGSGKKYKRCCGRTA